MEINNFSISIRSIILFEKLSNTPFSQFDDSDDSKIILLYCILVSHPENNYHKSFNAFVTDDLNRSTMSKMIVALNNELFFMSQFKSIKEDDSAEDIVEDSSSNEDSKPVWMKDVIPILVSDCGLSIEYVLDDMYYTDIEDYLRYREEKKKNDLLEKRLFTYLEILPHIDTKKKKFEPYDLLPFPFEKKEREDKAKAALKDNELRQKLIAAGIIKEKKESE